MSGDEALVGAFWIFVIVGLPLIYLTGAFGKKEGDDGGCGCILSIIFIVIVVIVLMAATHN